jgi:Big-like domain-containing protein
MANFQRGRLKVMKLKVCGFLALGLLAGSCHDATGPSPIPSSTPPQPDILVITPAVEGLKVGETTILAAELVSGSGAHRTVPASWSSGTPDVAAISEDGRVRALRPGKATIKATFDALAALQPLRVVPDYGGTWDGRYRIVNCTRFSGPGSDYCRFVVGGAYRVRAILTQVDARISGTIEFYDNLGTLLIETGPVEGSIDDSGALALTGTASSVLSEQPGETKLSDWSTAITADGDQIVGRFAKNPHFRNAFGWQESREDCEMVKVTRSPP